MLKLEHREQIFELDEYEILLRKLYKYVRIANSKYSAHKERSTARKAALAIERSLHDRGVL